MLKRLFSLLVLVLSLNASAQDAKELYDLKFIDTIIRTEDAWGKVTTDTLDLRRNWDYDQWEEELTPSVKRRAIKTMYSFHDKLKNRLWLSDYTHSIEVVSKESDKMIFKFLAEGNTFGSTATSLANNYEIPSWKMVMYIEIPLRGKWLNREDYNKVNYSKLRKYGNRYSSSASQYDDFAGQLYMKVKEFWKEFWEDNLWLGVNFYEEYSAERYYSFEPYTDNYYVSDSKIWLKLKY